MKSKVSVLALALAGAFPLAPTAHAQTTAELKPPADVQWIVDIDPLDML